MNGFLLVFIVTIFFVDRETKNCKPDRRGHISSQKSTIYERNSRNFGITWTYCDEDDRAKD